MRWRGVVLLFLSSPVLPLTASVDGFTMARSAGGVTEFRLDSNGLTVLLAPMEQATAATFSVTYRVGSRDESYGTTGSAHLLEHLMFKGTPRHNKEAGNGMDQILEGIGASTNATTSRDRTNYSTTLSPGRLPAIIGLEADRMRNLRLREEDLRPEMTVVMDEFRLGEDDPVSALDRGIWATAFQAHPYRHSVIGWRDDVENVPLSKLREFYETCYWPDNATVTVTGAFGGEDAILGELKRHFGLIPRAPRPVPAAACVEPEQTGLRRFEMKRAVGTGVITVAFKSPDARHPDFPALDVLCDLLADGQNSYFYNELTEAGLAIDTTAMLEPLRDPSLLLISAELAEKSDPAKTEDRILDILNEVIEDGVEQAEVTTSITRLSAQARYDRDSTQAWSDVLAESIAAGDWTLYQTREEALKKVTAADVQRVAKQWLREERCTIGWLMPDPQASANGTAAAPSPAPVAVAGIPPLAFPQGPFAALGDPEKIAARVVRSQPAGLDLLVCPSGSSGVARLTGSLAVGTPADQAIALFTAAMIERGTERHDARQLGDLLDETGSTLEFEVSDGLLHFTGRGLSDHLPRLFDVLAEQLRTPVFPEEEIRRIRQQLLDEAEASRTDAGFQAALAFNRALHPPGHPGRLPDADETISRLKLIRREDLVAFHNDWFGPASVVVVLTGDVDASVCQALVAKSFQGWQGGRGMPALPAPAMPAAPVSLRVPLAGKESVRVLLGRPCKLSPRDPEASALALASDALGNGFTSRLVHTVRDTEGLTYGVTSSVEFQAGGEADWLVAASFAPELADRGVASIRRELGQWFRDGLGEEEFSYRRNAMAGSWRMAMATPDGLATTLHAITRQGLPPEWLDEYPDRIGALTRDEVNAAIRKHLPPDRMLEVKCGDLP